MLIIGWLHWWQVHPPILINSGKHHPSKTTCRYSWHSYIQHPTSSTNEVRRIFGQIFTRLCHYSTDTSPHNRIEHIIAGHRWSKGNNIVQEDGDRHTHDLAPTRQKSSFLLIEHRWALMRRRRHIHSSKWRPPYTWLGTDEAKVIIFINTFCLHPMWRCCYKDWVLAIQESPSYTKTFNILHEDMMIITQFNWRFSTYSLCRCN
jgi:hypothetical protein